MPQEKKMVRMARGEATHISLVDRPANQTPFKVIKSDKSGDSKMPSINLSALMQRVHKSAEQSNVVAVVTHGKELDAAALEAHGLKVEEVVKAAKEDDGDVHVIQKSVFEDKDADLHIVALSPEVSVVCKGFRPYSDDFEETATFSELIKSRTLRLWDFGEVLADMLHKSLYAAEDKNMAVSQGVAILEDAKQYISELFNALPESVFKMAKEADSLVIKAAEASEPNAKVDGEGNEVKVEKSADEGTDGGAAADNGSGGEVPVAQVEGEKAEPTEQVVENVPAAEPAAEQAPAAEPEPTKETETVVKAEAAPVDVGDLVSQITKAVSASLEDRFKGIEDQVQSIAKTAQDSVDDVHKVLNNTVVSSVTKSSSTPDAESEDGAAEIGMIDTAYNRPKL